MMENRNRKLMISVLLTLGIASLVLLTHKPPQNIPRNQAVRFSINNAQVLTGKSISYHRNKSVRLAVNGPKLSTQLDYTTYRTVKDRFNHNNKTARPLVNGAWSTLLDFITDYSETVKPESRAIMNRILLDNWVNKHEYTVDTMHGSTGNRKIDSEIEIDVSGMEHWKPDWSKKTDMYELLSTRMQGILRRCETFSGEMNVWERNVSKVHLGTQSLSYCRNAKAGSTFWKHVIKTLATQRRATLLASNISVTFTTIRNPWHRLVSTYIEKFIKWSDEGQQFCPFEVTWRIPFRAFVQDCVLALWRRGIHNVHTMPGIERCDICNGNFDYAISVENMMTESAYMLSTLGVNNAAEFLQTVRNSTIRRNEAKQKSTHYQEYYDSLDIRDIKQLQDMYAFEIHVLQYPHSPYVDFTMS